MIQRYLVFIILLLISCKKITSPIEKQFNLKPDILFTSTSDGRAIVVSGIDGKKQFSITNNQIDPTGPFFTPDGRYVIYSAHIESINSRSILKYDLNKMETVQITDDSGSDSGPSMSFDGKMLAFSSKRENGFNNWNIYILNLCTHKIKRITDLELCYNPIFSADDSKILFSGYANGQNYLAIIDTNGTNFIKLESRPSFYSQYQFSLNGERIFYINSEGIVSINLEGTDKIIIAPNFNESLNTHFVNPVDSILYYTGSNHLTDICRLYRLNIFTGQKVTIKESFESFTFGDCSLDGKKILYHQIVDGRAKIGFLDLENDKDIFITDSDDNAQNPRFNNFLY